MTHDMLKQDYDNRIAQITAAENAERSSFSGKRSDWIKSGKPRTFREQREAAYQAFLDASARLNGYESFAVWQTADAVAFQAHMDGVQREIAESDDYDG